MRRTITIETTDTTERVPVRPLTGRLSPEEAKAYVEGLGEMDDTPRTDLIGFLSDSISEIAQVCGLPLALCPVCRFVGRHGQPCDVCAAVPRNSRELFWFDHDDGWDSYLVDAPGLLIQERRDYALMLHQCWLTIHNGAAALCFAAMADSLEVLRGRVMQEG